MYGLETNSEGRCDKMSDELLQYKLDQIRKKVETDPDIRKRKEKIILELSRLSYEQLHRIIRGSASTLNSEKKT